MKQVTLKKQIYLILIAFSLFPLLLISMFAQYFMMNSSKEYIYDLNSHTIGSGKDKINDIWHDLHESIESIILDYSFQRFSEMTLDQSRSTQHASYIHNIKPLFESVITSHPEVRSILFLDQTGRVNHYSTTVSINYNYPFSEDIIYKEIPTFNQPRLIGPHMQKYALSNQQKIVSIVMPVTNLYNFQVNSWIILEMELNTLTNIIAEVFPDNIGAVMMYNKDTGKLISNLNDEHEFYPDLVSYLHENDITTEQQTLEIHDTTYLFSAYPLDISDWYIIGATPMDTLLQGAVKTQYSTILIAVSSALIALLIGYVLIAKILRPIYELQKGMSYLSMGVHSKVDNHSRNEIGFLINTYNRMLDDLQRLKKEVWESNVKEKEKEVLQLQAQINPHFLFNTLETIEAHALYENGEAVEKLIQTLSRMMHYNTRNDGPWATVQEEVNYIKDFLSIHYYRNNMEITTKIQIEPEALESPVLKLSLQPFVENALKYGWDEQSSEGFMLAMHIRRKEQMLQIEITNNGMVIEPDILQQLQKLLASDAEQTDPFFKQHTGIYNIHRRFVLVYNNTHTIQINSNRQEGTVIRILLPTQSLGLIKLK